MTSLHSIGYFSGENGRSNMGLGAKFSQDSSADFALCPWFLQLKLFNWGMWKQNILGPSNVTQTCNMSQKAEFTVFIAKYFCTTHFHRKRVLDQIVCKVFGKIKVSPIKINYCVLLTTQYFSNCKQLINSKYQTTYYSVWYHNIKLKFR